MACPAVSLWAWLSGGEGGEACPVAMETGQAKRRKTVTCVSSLPSTSLIVLCSLIFYNADIITSQAGVMVQLAEGTCMKPWAGLPALHKLDMVVHACNSSTYLRKAQKCILINMFPFLRSSLKISLAT